MFFSTRNNTKLFTASEALLLGIARDGGLFLPTEFHQIDVASCLDLSYQELAFKILRPYLDDFSDEEVRNCIEAAYSKKNFPERVVGLKHMEGKTFLELFHGPTLTFKDMALSLLPHLMEVALKKHGKSKVHILTATSGDTGSAVLCAFGKHPEFEVSVLYPNGGISYVQERQMLSFSSSKSRAFALLNGNFDDCQTLIKKTMLEGKAKDAFSSANSINPFRLLPQIVYYFSAYIQLVNEKKIGLGQKIDTIVPTGNFGDVFAGFLAKKMGLPIDKLVVASNPNRILPDFLATGVYDLRGRDLLKTASPSMDILISSNLERLLYLSCGSSAVTKKWMKNLKIKKIFKADKKTMAKIREDFEAYCVEEKDSLGSIVELFNKEKYLIDPHTAVAYKAASDRKTDKLSLIVSTASPLKFPDTICASFNKPFADQKEALSILDSQFNLPMPQQLKEALQNKTPRYEITADNFHSKMLHNETFVISTPATSANLGPGFDVLGLALSISNKFEFRKTRRDEVVGYKSRRSKNLVLVAYQEFFKRLNLPYVPARIAQLERNIPSTRGLGSSASAIVAGLLGANAICNQIATKEQILAIASSMEGHPDNAAPCLRGGLSEAYMAYGEVQCKGHPVSRDLKALLFIPEQRVKTEEARAILPASYDFDVKQYQAERIPLLLKAFKEGDLSAIKLAIEDKIHVPYRSQLIKDYALVKDVCDEQGLPMTISGSGSTLIIFYKTEDQAKNIISAVENRKTTCEYQFIKADITREKKEIMNVAILGFGNIGRGVDEVISKHPRLKVTRVLDKPENKELVGDRYSTLDEIVNDPYIDIVVECMGGDAFPYKAITDALKQGKHVVTSNKETVSKHLDEYLRLAKENVTTFQFEASCMGGVSLIAPLIDTSSKDELVRFDGILNGTSNYILTQMEETSLPYFVALKDARRRGFAEADPSADVLGTDTLRKLSIVGMVAYKQSFDTADIPCYGISNITPAIIEEAASRGCVIRLIGSIAKDGDEYKAMVVPALVKQESFMGQNKNEINAATAVFSKTGEITFQGPGAGCYPTADAIMQDIERILGDYKMQLDKIGEKGKVSQYLSGTYICYEENDENGIVLINPNAEKLKRYALIVKDIEQ